jgi:hypothetical protein
MIARRHEERKVREQLHLGAINSSMFDNCNAGAIDAGGLARIIHR